MSKETMSRPVSRPVSKPVSRNTRPMSPCLSICTLDEDYICMGCLRTLEEIKGWALKGPAAQWALVEELEGRRAVVDKSQNT